MTKDISVKKELKYVLNISLHDDDNDNRPSEWVQVRSPISFFNCANKTSKKSAILTGTPFSYSSSNEFIAVSCGAFAKYETRTGNRVVQDGCSSSNSTCSSSSSSSNSIDFSNCDDGVKCCRTSFSMGSGGSYKISMDNDSSTTLATNRDNEYCKYAFLIDPYEIDKYKTSHDPYYVPALLSWSLNVTYFDIFKTHVLPTTSRSSSFDCEGYDVITLNSSLNWIYRCRCSNGFRGSAYIQDGCQGNPQSTTNIIYVLGCFC
ncbi:wall-associated receptor kinase-like 6 [Humulus lupulus]|uniref:wall-associated receptor kinase-like 6 n=1 Tax=Humulus lupulus TaxID=3486 RepID=UPI002B40CFBE|nr:wall-associated receptor kinase-like 6 [Humulus lupulus]